MASTMETFNDLIHIKRHSIKICAVKSTKRGKFLKFANNENAMKNKLNIIDQISKFLHNTYVIEIEDISQY
jgi:hypothetical protein